MKRLSLAFFGLPRGHLLTQPTLDRWMDKLSSQFELHVAYHLYHLDRVVNLRSGEDFSIPDAAYAWFEKFDGEVQYMPPGEHDEVASKIRAYGDPYCDGFRSIRSLLSQLRSIDSVAKRVQADRADAVLYLRPDLLYHEFPSFDDIARVSVQPGLCILPDWQWWGGVNDRFALCGARSHLAWGRRIEQVDSFLKYRSRVGLQAEELLRFALRRAGCRIRTFHLTASRVREMSRVQSESFDAAATRGGGRRLLIEQYMARWMPDWVPV
jgi:hypothetical protein